jgi:hypothetical protein
VTDLTVVNMWSGPRNVSTALMYSWRQRADTWVFDEPFYGLYLREFDPGHPGRDETIESMPLSYDETIDHLTAEDPRRVRYIKNIGHHLDVLDNSVLDLFANVLLLREPERVIASLAATMGTEIDLAITGLRQQVQILDHEIAAGRTPIVLDSKAILEDPASCLEHLCSLLGLDFDEAMLSWPPGAKPEDGAWGKYWYENTRASIGFGKHRTPPIPDEILAHPILPEARQMYEKLAAHITPIPG